MPLTEAAKCHLSDREPVVNPSTLSRKQTALDKFTQWLGGGDMSVGDVGPGEAGDYVDERPKGADGAEWNLGALSAAWRLFKRRRWVESNTWEGFAVDLKGSTRGVLNPRSRRPWTDAEVLKLADAIRDKRPRLVILDIRAHLLIGLCAGARREEIAGATVERVDTDKWAIYVTNAKTQNSVRAIPLHPVIRPLVAYLKDTSKNGMFLPEVEKSGSDGRYGKSFDNRTTFVLRKYVSEDKAIVFHSLRNSIERRMVKAGVPLEKYEQITGHRTQRSMSFDLYAQGTDLEDLHEQIAKVDYREAQETAE